MVFLDSFQAPNCSIQGSNFQKKNLSGGLCPPYFEVYAGMRVKLKKKIKKGTTSGGWGISGEGRGNFFKTIYTPAIDIEYADVHFRNIYPNNKLGAIFVHVHCTVNDSIFIYLFMFQLNNHSIGFVHSEVSILNICLVL